MNGKCGGCTLERELDPVTFKCGMCSQREKEAAENSATPVDSAAVTAAALQAAAESTEPRVIAQMVITLRSDGNGTIEGPLHDRKSILSMLNVAHDLSYEYERRAQEAAALASRPAPKKWSKAWWAEEFRRRAERKQLAAQQAAEVERTRRVVEAQNELQRQGGTPH